MAEGASVSGHHNGSACLNVYVAQGIGRSDVVNNLIDKGDQVDWRVVQFAAVIEASQEQKVFNEAAHLTSGLTDATHRILPGRAGFKLTLPPEIGNPKDHRHWGSEFVRGIGDELT